MIRHGTRRQTYMREYDVEYYVQVENNESDDVPVIMYSTCNEKLQNAMDRITSDLKAEFTLRNRKLSLKMY